MNEQPKDLMTLEETTGKLKAWQLELTRASKGEAMWGSLYFKSLSEDLGQALHHLEAGRRDVERLDYIESQFAQSIWFYDDTFIETDKEHQSIRLAIDASMPEPAAQEVKG